MNKGEMFLNFLTSFGNRLFLTSNFVISGLSLYCCSNLIAFSVNNSGNLICFSICFVIVIGWRSDSGYILAEPGIGLKNVVDASGFTLRTSGFLGGFFNCL